MANISTKMSPEYIKSTMAESVRIDHWFVTISPEDKKVRLHGEVSTHKAVGPGLIHTSSLIYVRGRLAYTRNTTYLLGKPSAVFLREVLKAGSGFDPDAPLDSTLTRVWG